MGQSNKIGINQLRIKLLYRNIRNKKITNIFLGMQINKLRAYYDSTILENLFLLELIGSLKSVVKSHKKSYQRLDVELQTIIRRKYFNFYFILMKIFYVPLLKRRGGHVDYAFDNFNNIFFKMEHIKYLPLIPEIFLRSNSSLLVSFYLKSMSRKESLLLINYFGGFK